MIPENYPKILCVEINLDINPIVRVLVFFY